MDADELVTAVRLSGKLPAADADFTSARVYIELYSALHTLFEPVIVAARSGYWRQYEDQTLTQSQARYRMPHRAVTGAYELIEVASGSEEFRTLTGLTTRQAQGRAPDDEGSPRGYVPDGDYLRLVPVPDSGTYTLRVWYPIRPSRIVQPQTAGLITAVDTSARTVTVNSVPVARGTSGTGSTTITSGSHAIDIVKPNGWHELALVEATQTLSGSVFTIAGTLDMSKIAVGDYVRASDETDWPCLPQDYHRSLADATASLILAYKGHTNKAQFLGGKAKGDIDRLAKLIQPRVKADPPILVPGRRVAGRRPMWQ